MVMYLFIGVIILVFLTDVLKMFAKWALLFAVVLTFLIACAMRTYGMGTFEGGLSCSSDTVGKTTTPFNE